MASQIGLEHLFLALPTSLKVLFFNLMSFMETVFLIYLALSFLALFTGTDTYFCMFYYKNKNDDEKFQTSFTFNIPKTTKSHVIYSSLSEYIKKEHPNATDILILSLNKI